MTSPHYPMLRLVLALHFLVLPYAVGADDVPLPDYRIVSRKDTGYGDIKRLEYRITLDQGVTEAEIRGIARQVVSKAAPHNAAMLLFYLPGTDTSGFFTAGKAEWAPNGKWGDAGAVKRGDYSSHRLVVTVGAAAGEVPKWNIVTGIPEARRRRIFYELVAAQDRGVGDRAAYGFIAQKFGISEKEARKVAFEGVSKGWPMP